METSGEYHNHKSMVDSRSSSSDLIFKKEDEEKMEKFYELIRRFREARDYQLSMLGFQEEFDRRRDDHDDHDDQKKIRDEVADRDRDHDQPSWVPSFKWEDFRDVDDIKIRVNNDHHHHHVILGTPNHHHHHCHRNHHPPPQPPPQGTVVQCSNCIHYIYLNDNHRCHHEKTKKRRKMTPNSSNDSNLEEEEERERKHQDDRHENSTATAGLDLNLAL